MRRALMVIVLFVSLPALATTYTVDDLGDASDATPGDDICATAGAVCTLRAAIEEANAHAGADTIAFSVAGTISPATNLPSVTGITTIDGKTGPGYIAAPVVVIDGAFSSTIGIHFALGSSSSALFALKIMGFSETAVLIDADNVTVQENFLGPIPAGTPNLDGLRLNGTGSTIGGADGEGNVISGNTGAGMLVTGADHVITDNFIGVDATGSADLGNSVEGIRVTNGTSITIGSGTAGEENVISGNGDAGVVLEGVGAGNTVAGNYIGVDAAGTAAIPNAVGIAVTAAGNFIGTPAARNIVSGNSGDGISIGGGANNTTVQNNFVGPDVTGLVGIGNFFGGIAAFSATDLLIGGAGSGEGNLVSFNGAEGVFFGNVTNSTISTNVIGLDSLGTSIRGNGSAGIVLGECSEILVTSNVVSGNSLEGIVDGACTDDVIELNRVGTNVAGDAALGNLATGIDIEFGSGAIVRSNLVSGNAGHGIEATLGATGTIIHSNIVGLSADLSTSLGNSGDGINVCDNASDTVVGSVALGGNTISRNAGNGIGVELSALQNNTWAANSIFNNTLLGIDIEIDGVTPNDPDDPDTGANNLQNFPDITNAVTTPSASQIIGSIDTLASTPFTIHFYSSPAQDPSGFGEGQTYLGTVSGTTDASGDATFTFAGPALTVGHVVTATATTLDGSSEFSEVEAVAPAPVITFTLANYPVGEAAGTATITLTRTGDLDAISTVQYATSDNTATAGSDYATATGTATFNPGEASTSFNVSITNDGTDEPSEIVNLALSNPTAATLGTQSTATLTIADDDIPPTISIGDRSLLEGDSGPTAFLFDVTLSAPSGFTVSIDYATANDTATSGSDYTGVPTTSLSFAPGVTTQQVTVNVTGDLVTEPDETFFVNLSNPSNATILDGQGLGTILNDDNPPTVTIGDVALSEGDSGNTAFTFTLTLSNPSASNVTVNYTTANGTAGATDYTPVTSSATILAGNLTGTLTVQVTGDALFEPDETFFVNLTGATNATISDNQAMGTILNDDTMPTVAIGNVSLSEGNAGNTAFTFTLTLSAVAGTDVTVNYATANGTATAADYTAATSSATIPAGSLTGSITIQVTGETLFETDETFVVNLTGATNATITDNQGLGTILNDDTMPTVAIGDVSLSEGNAGNTAFTFTLTLSAVAGTDVTVNYATANGTATAADYTGAASSATIPAGSLTGSITVQVTGETLFEADETFFVNLTGATNATITDNQGLGTILNDDTMPTVGIGDVTQGEGNAGSTPFTFTLTLSAVAGTDVTVNYATANGTATAGSDYGAATSSVTIPAGSLTGTLDVQVTGDVLFEPDETFFVNLTGATNATITDNQGQGTIVDDESVPAVAIGDVTLSEGDAGNTAFTFTLTLSAVSGTDVTVNYTTTNGTATAGSDYTAATSSATIPAGSLTGTITVQVSGDVLFETNETFFVNLTGATNATITDNQGQGTIVNDDATPTVVIDDVSLSEGNSGNTPFQFTVTLSAISGTDVTVLYTTANGTATAGADYTAATGSLTIPAGSLTGTITIQVSGDVLFEPNETFFVNLTGATTDNQGQGTIVNDDTVPTVAVGDVSLSEGNAGNTPFAFVLTLSAVSGVDVTVNYSTANGTATAGTDYTAATSSTTIPAGSLTGTITVQVAGDVTVEPNETFFVNLTGATNATVTDNQGLGTIISDDVAPGSTDLSLEKDASVTTFTSGDQVTYTVTVENLGPADATNVVITDVLPSGTTYVSASGPGAICSGTTTVTCSVATLANGASAVITIVVTATGSLPITNTATLTSSSPADSGPLNNLAAATINPAAGATAIPTASEWALLMLVLGLALVAVKRT